MPKALEVRFALCRRERGYVGVEAYAGGAGGDGARVGAANEVGARIAIGEVDGAAVARAAYPVADAKEFRLTIDKIVRVARCLVQYLKAKQRRV